MSNHRKLAHHAGSCRALRVLFPAKKNGAVMYAARIRGLGLQPELEPSAHQDSLSPQVILPVTSSSTAYEFCYERWQIVQQNTSVCGSYHDTAPESPSSA